MTVEPGHYLALSAILFTIGTVGVLTRKNAIVVLMSIEIMLNGANLAFVTVAAARGDLAGFVMVLLVIAVPGSFGIRPGRPARTVANAGHSTPSPPGSGRSARSTATSS